MEPVFSYSQGPPKSKFLSPERPRADYHRRRDL